MVLQTESYPGSYRQQSYDAFNGPDASYSNFQGVTMQQNKPSYSAYPQMSNYPSGHGTQFGQPNGGDYYGNGPIPYPGTGALAPTRPTTGGYGSPYYESPHGYGSPHGHASQHGHGSAHGYGSGGGNHFDKLTHGHNSYGGGAGNHFNKPTHGPNGYGGGGPNYGYSPSGMNHGYQKPSWTLKGLDDEE